MTKTPERGSTTVLMRVDREECELRLRGPAGADANMGIQTPDPFDACQHAWIACRRKRVVPDQILVDIDPEAPPWLMRASLKALDWLTGKFKRLPRKSTDS